MADRSKGARWPSTAEVDLQRQLDEEKARAKATTVDELAAVGAVAGTPRDVAVEDNDTSGYVGVSPEYQTYANETEKPLAADGGPQEAVEDLIHDRLAGAVGDVSVEQGKPTQGGGSNQPLVYGTVSGSDITPETVKRSEVYEESTKEAEEQQQQQPTPAAPTPPTPPASS
jgi:hypothetical protein